MWEVWMCNNLTSFVVLLLVLWTLESVDFLTLLDATLATDSFGPHACSSVFVEVKSASAFIFNIVTVDARVEGIADGWVWMSEESVLSWTKVIFALWSLCGKPISDTINLY